MMNGKWLVDCGPRAVLMVSGPDAVRYLNGQVTQDVRKVVSDGICLPACVTDAKGRIQFRVWLSAAGPDSIRVDASEGCDDMLEARLTRYLIADDVEVVNRSGTERLWHGIGADEGMESRRFGCDGRDVWVSVDQVYSGGEVYFPLAGGDLEAWRIRNGIPSEEREPMEGSFPAELGLDRTDVSFHKGCYIGQEVISRIQTAGKVNRRLMKFTVVDTLPVGEWTLLTAEGEPAGDVTSISPLVRDGVRDFLAMVKRGRDAACVSLDGESVPVFESV